LLERHAGARLADLGACGASKSPLQSLHLSGLILKTLPLWLIALLGHSLSHAPQPLQTSTRI
jgi:hypothetical protein